MRTLQCWSLPTAPFHGSTLARSAWRFPNPTIPTPPVLRLVMGSAIRSGLCCSPPKRRLASSPRTLRRPSCHSIMRSDESMQAVNECTVWRPRLRPTLERSRRTKAGALHLISDGCSLGSLPVVGSERRGGRGFGKSRAGWQMQLDGTETACSGRRAARLLIRKPSPVARPSRQAVLVRS